MTTSFPKDKIKVMLMEGIHQTAIDTFKAAGYNNIDHYSKALPKEQLIEKIKEARIIGIRSKTHLTAEVLQHADKLMAIGCFCIGTNQVDLEAATERGIAVFNSPYSNTRSVAELVIAETIMLVRQIPYKDRSIHNGIWLKSAANSHEIRGKRIGIVGYGHIGSQVSVLAEAMGMHVYYYDVVPRLPLGNAIGVDTLEELLSVSDIITLHVPATPETENMISRKLINKMNPGTILLNLSRGNVVDVTALAEALESGHILGAGIDVYPSEPKSKGDAFETPLKGKKNVVLTPHIGGSTQEAQQNIGKDAATKLINYIDKGITVNSHTVPDLNLPPNKHTHRVLHIHKNVPGILSQINAIISQENVNILGQYLKTNEQIGYVVFDINQKGSNEVLSKLKKIPNTIRARILY